MLGCPQAGTVALFNGLILSGSGAVLKQSNWKTDSRVIKCERYVPRKAGWGCQSDSSPKPEVDRTTPSDCSALAVAHAMSQNTLVFALGFFFYVFPSAMTSSNYLAVLHSLSYSKITWGF